MSRPKTYGVRRAAGKWEARPYVPELGRHVYVGRFTDRDEAIAAAKDLIGDPHSPRHTVASFARRWVSEYPRAKESTNDLNRSAAARIAEALGEVPLHALDRRRARAFALEHPSLARIARAMLTDAMDEGLLDANPFSNLRLPASRGRKDIEVLSLEEVLHLADLGYSCHAEARYGEVFRAMILTAALTGMRPGEIFGLHWPDVDFRRGEIHVQRQLYKYREQTPKNGLARWIVMPPLVAEALRDLPRFAADPYVFHNKTGKPLSQQTLYNYWNPVRAAFGRPTMGFYELRHFCATYLLELARESGSDGAADVARQLGHQDDGVLVHERYGHPDETAARERIHRLFERNVRELRPAEEEAADG